MAGTDDDISIDEKRVYGAKAGRTGIFVAAETGLVRVTVSGDKIGEFGIVRRGETRDVAVLPTPGDGAGRLVIATPEDVLVGDATEDPDFAETEFGAAVAVGVHDGDLLAAGTDGMVSHLQGVKSDADWESDADWKELGAAAESEVAGDVRAISGPLVASDAGVFRVVDEGISNVGLADVRDVAGAGIPLAATGDGLYWLGNGWMDALEGPFDAVASDGAGHAHAAGEGNDAGGADAGGEDAGALYTHQGDEWDTDHWTETALPVDEDAVALGYGPGVAVAVTAGGTVCVDAGDGWRHQVVGVRGIGGVAVERGR